MGCVLVMKCSIKLVLSDLVFILSLSSLHPSRLTWGVPLFATRSLHRWLKSGDKKIILAWAVLTPVSSCELISPLNTSSRGQTTERTLREHGICFLSYWLFIFRSVDCIMNGFSALREWGMISLALGDREDMSERCSGGRTRTCDGGNSGVAQGRCQCLLPPFFPKRCQLAFPFILKATRCHEKFSSPIKLISIGWNNLLLHCWVSKHYVRHLIHYYDHSCLVNYASYNSMQQKL